MLDHVLVCAAVLAAGSYLGLRFFRRKGKRKGCGSGCCVAPPVHLRRPQ